MRVAFSCNHKSLLAHPCSQKILADMWQGGLRMRRYQNAKVLITLAFPLLILKMSFKSRDQLQLMPRTEEEYLYYLRDDVFEEDYAAKATPRNSVTDQAVPAVTSDKKTRNSVKFAEPFESNIKENASETTSTHQISSGYRSHKQLRLAGKIAEFYDAPITKYWIHAFGYFVFIVIYAYLNLVRLDEKVFWQEWYIIVTVGAFGLEAMREILGSEPVKLTRKIREWIGFWHLLDIALVVEFYVGMVIRLQPGLKDHGRVFYLLNLIYWVVRTLQFLFPFRYIGPLVTMMATMTRKMLYFCAVMFIFLTAYGIFRQSLLYPNEEPSWVIARNVFYKPHMMIYGEEFVEEGDAACHYIPRYPNGTLMNSNDTDVAQKTDNSLNYGDQEFECTPGRWLNPFFHAGYLMMTYLLIVNMIIAMFNMIYFEYAEKTRELWLFNRFEIVTQYEEKPLLPPPFIIVSHLYRVLKWFYRCRTKKYSDHGLKLFLDDESLERLLDFEEECMVDLERQKERTQRECLEERIREINEKVDKLQLHTESKCHKNPCQDASLGFLSRQSEESSFFASTIPKTMKDMTAKYSDLVPDYNRATSTSSVVTALEFKRLLSDQDEKKSRILGCASEADEIRSAEGFEDDYPSSKMCDGEDARKASSGRENDNFFLRKRLRTQSETDIAAMPGTLSHYSTLNSLIKAGIPDERKKKTASDNEFYREVEGHDYEMMEEFIQRRMSRDSQNLDQSLEDLFNAPMKDDNMHSISTDEDSETVPDDIAKFVIEGNALETDGESDHESEATEQETPVQRELKEDVHREDTSNAGVEVSIQVEKF